ncbi:MAG: hypothetical protein F4X72_04710 [Dehalococcoidia bacterium]|nr:hypothetical protein [Dehalococcoidia bacterium]
MRPQGCEPETLRALAEMPFLDRVDLVAVTGRSKGAVYEAVDRLEGGSLVTAVPYATDILPQTLRYYLSAAGMRHLAEQENTSLDELVRDHPIAARWRRILMERMDALAAIYRLAAAIASVAYPVRFHWYRGIPLDAAVELPGGRTVGIIRQGHTADRSPFSRRLWRMRQGHLPGVVLALMADDVRLRHARRSLMGADAPFYLAREREAVAASPDDPVWIPPAVNAQIELRSILDRIEEGSTLPEEDGLRHVSLPAELAVEGPGWNIPDHLLPATLRAAEKRALDLIFDWPWIALTDLAGLMNVSVPRASQIVAPLEGFRLVFRPTDAARRLTLTDRALALLARRDRTSLAMAKSRWSASPLFPGTPLDWENVTGARSRQLLRNLQHSAAVHVFLAAMTVQADLMEWEVVQVDPPRRASRHFRYEEGQRSVNPDAFGVLRKGETVLPFFLEWERRAVRPSTMSARLAPYLRYYSSHRPTDDHGTRPSVLVVFDDETAHTHFLRVAREEMQAKGVDVPLWISHASAIEKLGPLGRAWRTPNEWESPKALLPQ